MITEDYVSFEMAKLLKEKGFDEKCRAYYKAFPESRIAAIYHSSENRGVSEDDPNEILCPTLQMAMKWLRETHNQIIVPGISLDDRTSGTINHYIVGIWYIPENNGGAFCYTSPTPYEGYPSFEEACEAGIRYCLEKLI